MVEFRMRVAHVTQYLIRWTVPIFLPFRKEKSPFRISAPPSRLPKWLIKRLDRQPRYSCSFLVFLFFFFFFLLGIGRRLFEDARNEYFTESFNFPRSLELFDREVRGNILNIRSKLSLRLSIIQLYPRVNLKIFMFSFFQIFLIWKE